MRYFYLCITDTRYGYGDTGTAICEFKKRHSGSIERVSEYRSIGYGYGWVSEVSVIHRWELSNQIAKIVKMMDPYIKINCDLVLKVPSIKRCNFGTFIFFLSFDNIGTFIDAYDYFD